jgi:NADH:ubiquinone oxidoreductase subunit 4 (subunit M)
VLLTATLFAPLVGALLVALVPASREQTARLVALAASLATLVLAVVLAARFRTGEAGFQLGMTAEWVPAFGISYQVGVDGVSLPLVLLTTVLTPLAVAAFLARTVDQRGIVGAVNGLAELVGDGARRGRRVQSGLVRSYALGVLGGAVLIVAFLVFRP